MRESTGPELRRDDQLIDLCLCLARFASRRLAVRHLLATAEGETEVFFQQELVELHDVIDDLEEKLHRLLSHG